MRYFKVYFFSMLLVLLIGGVSLLLFREPVTSVPARGGVIDLGALGEEEVASIGGSWEFYDSRLYEDLQEDPGVPADYAVLPHIWLDEPGSDQSPYGYAAYRVILEGLDPDQYYGIFIRDESLSYQLWANGRKVLQNGKVARTKEDYLPMMQSRWAAFTSDSEGRAELVMDVANYDNYQGGFWQAPQVGTFKIITQMAVKHTSFEVFLFTSMLLMAMLLFALYATARNKKTSLLLGLFSLLVALRVLLTGYRLILGIIPELPLGLMLTLEYAIGYLLLPLAGYVIASLGYVRHPRFLSWIYNGLLLCAVAISIFAFDKFAASTYYEFYKFTVILLSLYFFYALISGIRNRKEGAIPLTIGYALLINGSIGELFFSEVPFLVGVSSFVMLAIFVVVQIVNFHTLKLQKETLETEIIVDKLTSVQNRTSLEQLLEGADLEPKEGHRWFVFFVDINRFKFINDTYGHAVGDSILAQVASVLKSSIRDADQVYRYGGDEFIIFARLEQTMNPEVIKERILSQLQKPLPAGGRSLQVGVSIGLTEYRQGSERLEEAILRSDMRMYEEKISQKKIFTNF